MSGDGADRDAALWATRASSFGAAAREYAEHRPDYPAAAIAWALGAAGRPVRDVLDLGAGTGLLTGGLLAAGLAVSAVEPDPEMRAVLTERWPDVAAYEGTAEAIPLPDGSVDAVVAGQAAHWFARDRAMPEIARVLRPHGAVGLLWNHDDESVPWIAELNRVSGTSVEPVNRAIEGELPAHPLFAPFEERTFPHRQRRTAASLTATVATHSRALVVSAAEREETLARVRAFLDAQPETAAGEFDRPLLTLVARTRLA